MKSTILVLLAVMLFSSCKSRNETFQPMADYITKYFAENIPDAKSLDTLYVLVDTVTPRLKRIIQSVEYHWASTEAKKVGSADSSFLENNSYRVLDLIDNVDSTTFLFFRARSLVIYTKNTKEKAIAEKWLYFDNDFQPISKYSFVQKIAKFDRDKLLLENYVPFTPKVVEYYKAIGYLEYH